MKNEEFASIHHFSAISSHFYARLSQTHTEYPTYLECFVVVCTFAASND